MSNTAFLTRIESLVKNGHPKDYAGSDLAKSDWAQIGRVMDRLLPETATRTSEAAPTFQECSAFDGSCSYRPHGRHGEMQCQYCWAAKPEAAPVAVDAKTPIPLKEIESVLNEAMEQAVANGADSRSMPDAYVAIAHFLCYPHEYALDAQRDASKTESKPALLHLIEIAPDSAYSDEYIGSVFRTLHREDKID